ncbi:MAG: 5-formyltetrahydrofolate cyclo-ligase [Alphaproteobacteria bacterium]
MSLAFPDKASARDLAWRRLEKAGAARPPLPARGRIPNFAGAEAAAQRLFDLEPWHGARRIKVNPDTPQAFVRAEALRRGIAVYIATPRLAGGFMLLDPARIPPERAAEAAARANWPRFAVEIPLAKLPQMDAIVCGSVAVTVDGRRAGKGAGYSDLESAILVELGHAPAPVATTVHDLQVVGAFPVEAIDQRLSAIATPTRCVAVPDAPGRAVGIDWARLPPDALAAMPVLAAVRRLRGGP